MYEQFHALTRSAPDSPSLIDGASGQVTSRRALLAQTDELAARLIQAGAKPRDILAVQLPNSVDFIAAVLAAWRQNIVVMPIDRDAPGSEVAALLNHFSVRALAYRTARTARELTLSIREATPPALPPEVTLLKLSSGSTGLPKAIMTTEKNLVADCTNICRSMQISADDINLGAIPFSHSYGFSNLVTPLFLQGTPLIISNDYLPQTVLDLCNQHRCTVAPLIPMVYDHLTTAAEGRFATVRTFISAGGPLPASVSRRFRERFGIPIHTFYGCSECGGISYDRQGGATERGSVGEAMSGVTLSANPTTQRLTVESDSVAVGYLHATGQQDLFTTGSFVTDDMVQQRENNEIALVGRVGDLINTAGKKVNPREIEQVLLQMNGVREAKVYGEPAGARGEVVAAAVVADPDVTRESVREFCRQRLSSHKVPRIVKLIESIPVDERGKVRRSVLAEL
jgi:long-chain acyl-CoA synthetase